MDTAYWNLFWSTGMPEAWLMSRDQGGAPKSAAGPSAEPLEGPAQPGADFRSGLTGGVSAGPQG